MLVCTICGREAAAVDEGVTGSLICKRCAAWDEIPPPPNEAEDLGAWLDRYRAWYLIVSDLD